METGQKYTFSYNSAWFRITNATLTEESNSVYLSSKVWKLNKMFAKFLPKLSGVTK